MPVYNSQVYWHVVRHSIVAISVILMLLWGWFAIEWYRERQITRDRLTDTTAQIVDRIQSKNVVAIDTYIDESAQWTDDFVFEVFEDDDLLIRVVNADGRTLTGYDNLEASAGFSTIFLSDHDELDHHPVTALRTDLSAVSSTATDARSLIVARFYPDHLYELTHNLRIISILVVVIGVILALYIATVVTALVSRRLGALRHAAAAVSGEGFTGRIPIADDADDFDQVAKEINALAGRADALTRNMRDVTVGVAHDLKTPLSNISGRLQLIERDARDHQSVVSHAEVADEHVQSLKRTLDALLRLGEVEAGARRAAFSTVDVSAVVADMAETYAPVFEEADKVLNSEVQAGVEVTGDRELLMQLIGNLLENALEHSRDGASACMRLRRVGTVVRLQVEDDGPGIPEQFSQRVFERFYRMDSSRGSAGNGLGLSLVKSIAELHDGSATMHYSGGGAGFTIEIPVFELRKS